MEHLFADVVTAVTIAAGIQQLARPLIIWIRRHRHKPKPARETGINAVRADVEENGKQKLPTEQQQPE